MIADDEEDLLDLMCYNFRKEGFTVFSAKDGDTAFQIALEQRPDLIFLDIFMPKYDGFQVCQMLRENLSTRALQIAFLSSKSSELDQVHALELGVNHYIQKPISLRLLISQMKSLLRPAI